MRVGASIFAVALLWVLWPTEASAQVAFVEGHVFNKKTGVPLPGAVVRITENVTSRPVPFELAVGVTDSNGFYQFSIDKFLGFPAAIQVSCRYGLVTLPGHASIQMLREGTIRRDVYLVGRPALTGCQVQESDDPS